MASAGSDLTQASLQLAVAPVLYAIALRPEDPGQLRTAVKLASKWWGGIRFPWLPLAEDGAVRDDAQSLCDVLDVAGIIDLTRTDASEPAPSGLQALRPAVVPGGQKPPWAMPVRAVATLAPDAPLVVADQADATDIDPVALLGVGDLDASERASWAEAGQPVSVVETNSVLPQLDARTAVGVTATGVDDFISTSAFMTSTALVWVLPHNLTSAEVARDLTGFWNYRALRPQHRGTVTVLARLSELREEQTSRRLIEAISSTALSTPMCVFNGIAVSDDDLRDVADRLGFRVITGNTNGLNAGSSEMIPSI